MKETSVYKSKNQEIYHNAEKEFFNSVWVTNENISEEEHQQEFTNYFNIVLKYKPKLILVDAVDAKRAISVVVQKWMAETHFSKYLEIELKKLAILMSSNAATSLSIVQTIEEYDENTAEWDTKYFYNKNLALDWLNLK